MKLNFLQFTKMVLSHKTNIRFLNPNFFPNFSIISFAMVLCYFNSYAQDCMLELPVVRVECDDNGTSSILEDDLFTYFITVTGENVWASYNISGDDIRIGLAYGVEQGPYGPFPIGNGGLNLDIADNGQTNCTAAVSVVPPSSCSDVCNIYVVDVRTGCLDNGTPSNPSDDQFYYYLTGSGTNTGSGFAITGDDFRTGLLYNVEQGPFGLFDISNGSLNLTLTDNSNAECTVDVMINQPQTCSNVCNLNDPGISVVCDDSGTPADPADDVFYFYITITGINTGSGYNVFGDHICNDLPYNLENGPYGPYRIIDGSLDLTIIDKDDPGCFLSVEVEPPGTCSDQCHLNEPDILVDCDDNMTPTDPSDDVFFYYITVTGSGTGTTYSISGDDSQPDLAYNIQHGPFGSFDNSEGNLDLLITDSEDNACIVSAVVDTSFCFCRVGDFVWSDVNRNGVQEPFEKGIRNVTVNLYQETGELEQSVKTNAAGRYTFVIREKGNFFIEFVPPAGYRSTRQSLNAHDSLNNDLDHSNGPNTTGIYEFTPGLRINHIDAGFVNIGVLADLQAVKSIDDRVRLWPNPVSDIATLGFYLDQEEMVNIRIFNLNGQLVHEEMAENYHTGYYEKEIQMTKLAEGAYVVSITLGAQHLQQRLIVLRN